MEKVQSVAAACAFLCTGVRKEVSCYAARTPHGGQGKEPSLLDCTGVRKEVSCYAARTPHGRQGKEPSLPDCTGVRKEISSI